MIEKTLSLCKATPTHPWMVNFDLFQERQSPHAIAPGAQMTDILLEEARAVVREVRIDNGGTTDEDQQGATAAFQRSYDRLSMLAGNATTSLTADLYSSDVRFIFELIQNAEDNEYTHAFGHGD